MVFFTAMNARRKCACMCVKGLIDLRCDCRGLANLLSLCAVHVPCSFVFPDQGFVESSINVSKCEIVDVAVDLCVLMQFPSL